MLNILRIPLLQKFLRDRKQRVLTLEVKHEIQYFHEGSR